MEEVKNVQSISECLRNCVYKDYELSYRPEVSVRMIENRQSMIAMDGVVQQDSIETRTTWWTQTSFRCIDENAEKK